MIHTQFLRQAGGTKKYRWSIAGVFGPLRPRDRHECILDVPQARAASLASLLVAPLAAPASAEGWASECDKAIASLDTSLARLPASAPPDEILGTIFQTLAGPCSIHPPEIVPPDHEAPAEEIQAKDPGIPQVDLLPEEIPVSCPGGGGAGNIKIRIEGPVLDGEHAFPAAGYIGPSATPSIDASSTGMNLVAMDSAAVFVVAGVPIPLSNPWAAVACGEIETTVFGYTLRTPVACSGHGGRQIVDDGLVEVDAVGNLYGAGC